MHCILFALLLAFLNTKLMQDAYLLWVCYAILFFCATFCALSLPLGDVTSSDDGGGLRVETRRVVVEGAWQVVFVVFLAYAMMPLKTWVAAVFGFALPVVHVTVSAVFAKDFPHLTWQQVSYKKFHPFMWELTLKNKLHFVGFKFLLRLFHNSVLLSYILL